MSFVKLDTGILESSLWLSTGLRNVFITALLMAHPAEFTESIPQLKVRSLERTGFTAEPGWYGFVPASGVGIIRRALIDEKEGYRALELLGSPDDESRSETFEGRRMIRVNGGYLILNFMRYRDRDYTTAERARRYRERKKASRRDNCDATRDDRDVSRCVTQAEAEAEAEAEKNKALSKIPSSTASDAEIQIDAMVKDGFSYFLGRTERSAGQYKLDPLRKKLGRQGFKALVEFARKREAPDAFEAAGALFRLAVDRLVDSPFHNGRNDSGARYNDWHQLFKGKDFKPPTKLIEFWLDDARWDKCS